MVKNIKNEAKIKAKELVSKAVSYSQNKPDIKKLVYKEIK